MTDKLKGVYLPKLQIINGQFGIYDENKAICRYCNFFNLKTIKVLDHRADACIVANPFNNYPEFKNYQIDNCIMYIVRQNAPNLLERAPEIVIQIIDQLRREFGTTMQENPQPLIDLFQEIDTIAQTYPRPHHEVNLMASSLMNNYYNAIADIKKS